MAMGFGEFVDKERMASDKLFPAKNCFSAFIKKDIKQLQDENLQCEFFKLARDKGCNIQSYVTNYDKDMDKICKQVAAKYSSKADLLHISPINDGSISK